MINHKFIGRKENKLIYGTFIDSKAYSTITIALVPNKLLKQIEIAEINALGYERSQYKYELIKHIIDDFSFICLEFDFEFDTLVCKNYYADEVTKYISKTGMLEKNGKHELYIMPAKHIEKHSTYIKKINVK